MDKVSEEEKKAWQAYIDYRKLLSNAYKECNLNDLQILLLTQINDYVRDSFEHYIDITNRKED